jgi:hypothetical protein
MKVMLFVALLFTLGAPAAAAERPNVVVILCDDLGYGDLACYGHPTIRTPNLDSLAAQGWRLTDCYAASPVCSPSRVGPPDRADPYPGERLQLDPRRAASCTCRRARSRSPTA